MGQKRLSRLPRQSIRYLLICSGGILAFIFLGLYPYQKSLAGLDREIKSIETQIEEQKILFPLYKDLLKKVGQKEPDDLSPQKAKLDLDRMHRIPFMFEEIARKSNLTLVNVVPNVESLAKASGLLSLNVLVKGNFFDFRTFLLQARQLPYLEHIEEIKIQPADGPKEFRLKVWLALKR